MEISFLTTADITPVLKGLIAEFDEFHWAIAWGSMTEVGHQLFHSCEKIRDVTFGIAFSQTDPDLIDKMAETQKGTIVKAFPGGTFHPKVYAFRSSNTAAAIVGSANFTFGGLGKNSEAVILVRGNADAPFFKDIFAFTRKSAESGHPVTHDLALAYRISHKRAERMPKPPHDPIDSLPPMKPKALSSDLLSMSWPEYVQEIGASAHHDIGDSLELLRIAQTWFASVVSFADLSRGQRQAIAGLVVDRAERDDAELSRDWGWFGSMKGMGDFASLIIHNDPHMALAIDSIPQSGEVGRRHFEVFAQHFEKAFEQRDRTGGYATASRLLAMKRPDIFLCVCSPNISKTSDAMGFSKSTLKLSDYWDKVVEVIRLSEWYNADKPGKPDNALWEYRAAMLDAILYEPPED